MRPARTSLLLAFLGVLLLANGAYLFPGNVSYEEEYRATAEKADWPTGEFGATSAHEAWRKPVEEWAVDRSLADGGEIRVDDVGNLSDELAAEEDLPKDYVLFEDGYYRRTASMENDTLVVAMEQVPREHVLRSASRNASEVEPVVRRAIENGTATTTEPLADRQLLIAHAGEHYVVRLSGPHRGDLIGLGWRDPGQDVVQLLRLLGWLSGTVLLWSAGYRYANRR